ncbi:hypothetical protein [Thermorudis peleae]|uniref:DUF5656 family protein n=1 Tax=Thermorudis peleae TaxID=1382356 RepID=UPI00057075A4|nr:hypothetical protein [Thermorudis peleae]
MREKLMLLRNIRVLRHALVWGMATLITVILGILARRDGPRIGEVPLLSPYGRLYWLVALVSLVLVGGVAQWQQRQRDEHELGEEPVAWIAPVLTILAATLVLAAYAESIRALVVVVLGVVFLLIWHTLTHRLLAVENLQQRLLGQLGHTLFVHLLALILLAMIYVQKLRSLYSAVAIVVVTSMLSFLAMQGVSHPRERRLLYAILTGLILGETTWALNYWRATGWLGGAVLFVCFYFITGLILAHLERALQVRDVVEYGGVALLAFGILTWAILR